MKYSEKKKKKKNHSVSTPLVKPKVIGVKNVKICPQKKKAYLMPPSKHGYFHPILILLLRMVEVTQQHDDTSVH